MQVPQLFQHGPSRGVLDRVFLFALLLSVVLHGGTLYAVHRWGDCVCHVGRVVCPKLGQDCEPRVDVKLVQDHRPTKPPPLPPKPKPKPKPKAEPAVTVEKPMPNRPPAAPKAGKVVLPDEAFEAAPAPQSGITLDRPALSEDVVVRESEVDAAIIVSGEIFGRAHELTPGEAGAFGLGGTGTAVGVGPFGTEEEGGGTAEAVESPAPVSKPEPPPRPKGPSRPPRVIDWIDPPYPEQARQQGIEGTVVLKLTVGIDGSARNVTVFRSAGHAALDQAAVAHVRKTRFSPALRDGYAVAAAIAFRVRFRLVNT